ncbi:MAG: transketolase, partial [Olsenella sp.]
EVTGLGDIADKYRMFGWNVVEIDGHDMGQIVDAFDNLPPVNFDKPTVIVCHTVKGHGVDFMENQVKWHAGHLSEESRDDAIGQLRKAFNEKWGE